MFVLGLAVGAGLVTLGFRLPHAAKPVTAGPLQLGTPAQTWDNPTANAVIPPIARTAGDFQPVYLDDNMLAARERAMVSPGNAVAHEKIEAERR